MLRVRIASLLIAPKIVLKKTSENSHYNKTKKCINIGKDFGKENKHFLRHVEKGHSCVFAKNFSIKTWLLLHEIGHYYTFDKINPSTEDQLTLFLCQRKLEEAIEVEDLAFWSFVYFGLEQEWVATEWAIQFIYEHQRLVKFLNKLLK